MYDIPGVYLSTGGRAMGQAVSRRSLTAEARVRFQASHEEFVVDEVALRQISLRVLRFPPVNIIPPLLHTH